MMPQAATDTPETVHLDLGPLYAAHVNPRWVSLLDLLGMNVTYTRCRGTELTTSDGRTILDFLSGYCVYNTGHNHPRTLAALERELKGLGPHMLQSHVPALAAELAQRLCALAGGRLTKVFFTSSGSEGIETVIKFSRAQTGRNGLLYCDGSFHGLTTGALSLMGNTWWRDGFGPLLPGTAAVPFGDIALLERAVETREFAAFIIEPVQAESGIRVPPAEYLEAARRACRRTGTLFVLDEVQTGLHRTGPFLAAHHFGLDPDMVVLAKALSGGLIPCGAVLMTDTIHRAVYSSLSRSFIHASTFGENGLAMRAALATLDVLANEQLGARSLERGEALRGSLRRRIGHLEMVEEVRGIGLLNGISFRPPRSLSLRVPFQAFGRLHPGLFGQMVVSTLFRREGMLTQMCGHDHMVLKVAPPLVVTEAQTESFVEAVGRVLDGVHSGLSFWREGAALMQRAVGA
jgi:ornithine--oxo-acid transaminase